MICVNSVNVYPQRIAMKTGEWYYNARAEVCPSNASCPCVTWSSSDPSIAIVHPTNGYIHGGRPGTATVYATATDGSGRRGCCQITVTAPGKVTGIAIYPAEQTLRIGMSTKPIITVLPKGAANQSVLWHSSNPQVATVEYSTGSIETLSEGTAIITATTVDGGFQATCRLRVYAKKAIIIVPDAMGTKLISTSGQNNLPVGTQIWPPLKKEQVFSKAEEYCKALQEMTFSARNANDAAIDSTDSYGAYEIYKNLYHALNDIYGADRDVLFFGYDWRQPNSVSGTLLKEKVNTYDDVIIIAHSMGGSVTSHILKSEKTKERINKVIILGTPYLEAIDTILFMLHDKHKYIIKC